MRFVHRLVVVGYIIAFSIAILAPGTWPEAIKAAAVVGTLFAFIVYLLTWLLGGLHLRA